jgi:hypothetical protein
MKGQRFGGIRQGGRRSDGRAQTGGHRRRRRGHRELGPEVIEEGEEATWRKNLSCDDNDNHLNVGWRHVEEGGGHATIHGRWRLDGELRRKGGGADEWARPTVPGSGQTNSNNFKSIQIRSNFIRSKQNLPPSSKSLE